MHHGPISGPCQWLDDEIKGLRPSMSLHDLNAYELGLKPQHVTTKGGVWHLTKNHCRGSFDYTLTPSTSLEWCFLGLMTTREVSRHQYMIYVGKV